MSENKRMQCISNLLQMQLNIQICSGAGVGTILVN